MVGFILKTFGQIMKCLFRCFCLTYSNHTTPRFNPPSSSSTNNNTNDHPLSRNRLASLLVSEREDDGSDSRDMESPSPATIDRELKDEAQFLKSCGTILETPIEIRKASERVKDVLPSKEDSETSKYHSWLPNASIEKLSVGLQNASDSPVHEPNKEMETSHCLVDKEVILYTPDVSAATNQYKNKSVRFDIDSDSSSITSSGENMKQFSSAGSCNDFKHFPYPTPPQLSDEMQTPGTAYPMYSVNLAQGERARIRSQYAYNVLNPIQNFSELMALKETDYYNHEKVESLRQNFEQRENATPTQSFVSSKNRENTHRNEAVDVSLSQWLKPPAPRKNDKVQNPGSDIDRPIIGTVAAHWNEVEPSQVSPKWWDGNGIPNSTHKYNENRPVSWHATPFEERLEKALSNETLVSQRRLSIEPVGYAENEEDDTAVSRLQASKSPASVISF